MDLPLPKHFLIWWITPRPFRMRAYRDNGEAGVKAQGHQAVYSSLSIDPNARGLDGFIQTVASLLLIDSEAWLEVAFCSEEESTTQFQMHIVSGVHQEPAGRITQDLPHRDELPDWYPGDEAWGQTVELDPDLMVHISLPGGYPSGLIEPVISELAKISISPTPDWALRQMIGQYPGTPRFDHAEAYQVERLRILEVASPIGWTARGGLVCLNSAARFDKWNHAAVR